MGRGKHQAKFDQSINTEERKEELRFKKLRENSGTNEAKVAKPQALQKERPRNFTRVSKSERRQEMLGKKWGDDRPLLKPKPKPQRRHVDLTTDREYQSLRSRARHEAQVAANCIRESKEARKVGDSRLSGQLLTQEAHHKTERDRLNREASELVFEGI